MTKTTFPLSWERVRQRLGLFTVIAIVLSLIEWWLFIPAVLVIVISVPNIFRAWKRGVLQISDAGLESPFFGFIRWEEIGGVKVLGESSSADALTDNLGQADSMLLGGIVKLFKVKQLSISLCTQEAYLSRLPIHRRQLMKHFIRSQDGGPTLDMGFVDARPEEVVRQIRDRLPRALQ